tara:strand:- start:3565 stop:3762 length:198 start_codon:yes stop_codon:yes gene_type:complete
MFGFWSKKMVGAEGLGLAIEKRLDGSNDKDELIAKLTKAVGDHGKISPIEWSTIGKRLGVFDVAK